MVAQLQLQLGVEQDAGSNPPPILKTPSCTDACFPARSCIARCQGHRSRSDLSRFWTLPFDNPSTCENFRFCFGFAPSPPSGTEEPKILSYRRSKQRLRPGKGVARRWQSRSRSKSSFWTSVGRSYFRIRLPCFQGQGGWVGDLCLGSVTCIAQR